MKGNASGASSRDVLINLRVQQDPGNAARARAAGATVGGAGTSAATGTAAKGRTPGDMSNAYYNDLARHHLAQMSRQRQYAEAVRRTEEMKIRAQRQEEARARARLGGMSQALVGGARVGRGLMMLGAAAGGTEAIDAILNKLLIAQGAFDTLVGGLNAVAGVRRYMGARGVAAGGARAASLAGVAGAGRIGGMSLGGGAMAVGGAALAAVAGAGLGINAIFDGAGTPGRVDPMTGRRSSDSWNYSLGSMYAGMNQGIARMAPGWLNRMAPSWTPYGAAVAANENEDRIYRIEQRRNAAQRFYAEQSRMAAPGQASADFLADHRLSRPGQSGLAGISIQRSQLMGMSAANSVGLGNTPGDNYGKIVDLRNRELAIQQKILALSKEEMDVKRRGVSDRISMLSGAAGSAKAEMRGIRAGAISAQEAVGRMSPGDRARFEAASKAAEKNGLGALSPEQRDLLESVGGVANQERFRKFYREQGKAPYEGSGLAGPERDKEAEARKVARGFTDQIQNIRVGVQVQIERNSQELVDKIAKGVADALENRGFAAMNEEDEKNRATRAAQAK